GAAPHRREPAGIRPQATPAPATLRSGRAARRSRVPCRSSVLWFERWKTQTKRQTKRGPVGPFVQYRWIPAWPPAAGDHEAQASRKRKRLRRAFNATRKSVVAGAGFEPATFGL